MRRRGDRFFDEISASTDAAAAVAAAAAPAPSEGGGDGSTPSPQDQGSPAASRDGTSDPIAASPQCAKRPFLAGVPYLRAPLDLTLASGTPPFTNFTPEFTETLDYVFIEGGSRGDGDGSAGAAGGSSSGGGIPARAAEGAVLRVERVVDGGADAAAATTAPMPEEATLRAETPGLPSETFPSDHVSLVVDLALST